MKRKSIFATTIITLVLLVLSTGTALASTYEGRLDTIQGNTVSGWAWDSADQSSSAVVRVVVKKQGTSDIMQDTIVTANQHRADLASSGKGNGSHAFSATVDWSKFDQTAAYTVETYVGDLKLGSLNWQNGQVSAATGKTAATGNMVSLGLFKTTAYCPCYSCSEGWGRQTSTGALAASGHTIAVDPRVIPYGSKIMINGTVYTAEDKGGGVKGNHIDIYFNTHGETRQYGTRRVEVFLVQ